MNEQVRLYLLSLSDQTAQFATAFDTFAVKARRAQLIGAADTLAAYAADHTAFPEGSGLEHITPQQALQTLQAIGAMLEAVSTNHWDRALVAFLRTP